MRKILMVVLTALATFLLAVPPAAGAPAQTEGLWADDVVPVCIADGSGPCFVSDFGGVELGVRFQTTEPIYVVGLRFYRADDNTWSGSLWGGSGSWITSASDSTSGAGWQTAMFGSPQPMGPGDTFVASYFAPSGAYAFEWDYFTNGGRTVGPVTALGGAGANGVFTYGPGSVFPTSTFRDTNYWVTPLWIPQYTLSGFYEPVNMDGVFNTVKGGSTVPLKFEIFDNADGIEETDVAAVDRFEATPVTCPDGSPTVDPVEVTSTGGTSLRYDFSEGQFIQNWKTPKKPGKCYEVTVYTVDGSSISAKFQLK